MTNTDGVEVFVAVVQAGSFVEASKLLGVPANTLSRKVGELERELDTRLLTRTTRKLTLTLSGKTLYDQCAPAIRTIITAKEVANQDSQTASGVLRVNVPLNFFDFFKLEWLWEFMAENPAVRLQFILSGEKLDFIDDNIDLVFRGGYVADSTLLTRKIHDFHFCLVASPEYLKKHGTPDTLASLMKHQCIIMPEVSNNIRWIFESDEGMDVVQVSGHFAANTPTLTLEACKAGVGIALLPSFIVDKHIKSNDLIRVLPKFKSKIYNVNLVYLNRPHMPKALSSLIEFILMKHTQIFMEQFKK